MTLRDSRSGLNCKFRFRAKSLAPCYLLAAVLFACSSETRTIPAIELMPVYNDSGELCANGLAIIESDFQSTNLSIYDLEGSAISSSFFSSASASANLNAALSVDVVLPTVLRLDDFVVIDRAQSVLTRLDIKNTKVDAQLRVADGFFANPQDYLQLEMQALVSRSEANPKSGSDPLSAGDDLAVIDWSQN